MRFEIVDAPVHEPGGVEDAVAAMDHVVVERDQHQRRIGDDAAELARIERVELHRLPRPQRAQAAQHVVGVQHPKGGCARRRHVFTH